MLIINIAVTQIYAEISLYFQPFTERGEHQIHFSLVWSIDTQLDVLCRVAQGSRLVL